MDVEKDEGEELKEDDNLEIGGIGVIKGLPISMSIQGFMRGGDFILESVKMGIKMGRGVKV